MIDMSARRRWFWTAVVLAVLAVGLGAGCPPEYPQKPQLLVHIDPNPFDFGPRFVGTFPSSSLSITNKGLDDLVIGSITLTGDPAFWPTNSKNRCDAGTPGEGPCAYKCQDPDGTRVDCPNPTF